MTQHQNTATLFSGIMHSPLLTAALQDRLAAGLYHCNYTYGDLLCIQVCSDPTPEHCNTAFCKWHSPLLTAALQDRLAAGLYHCKYIYEDFLFIQVCSDPTPGTATLLSANGIPQCSGLLCKTGLQQACITASTSMKISSSYRCAVTQHQRHCNTAFCKWQSPLLSAALQDRLAAGLYHCNYIYEDLLFIQVCSDPTPEHCNTVFCKMHSPLLTAALQDRLAAGLYHCNYTYGDLLCIQVCSDPTPEHCNTVFWQNAFPTAHCCSARQACSRLVSLQLHLWRFALHTGVQ